MPRHRARVTAGWGVPHIPRPGRHAASSGARHVASSGTEHRGRKRGLLGAGAAAVVGVLIVVVAVNGGTTTTAAAGTNLVANSDFESGTWGWSTAADNSLTRATGHGGNWSGRLVNTDTTQARTAVLNDRVNTVPSTTKGATYTASAWVRASVAGASVSIRLMEHGDRSVSGQQQDSVWLRDTDWRLVSATYTAQTDGASIDLNVLSWGVPPGGSVDVDDVVLTASVPTVPAPVLTPAPEPPPATSSWSPPSSATTEATPSTPSQAQSPNEPAPSSGNPTTSAPAAPASAVPPPSSSSEPVPSGSSRTPDGWHLVWSDEFSGGDLDTAKWTAENNATYGDGNQALSCALNRPQNLFQADGVLTLRALREAEAVECGSDDERFPDGRDYTSAHITTKGKAAFEYGRFEIRAKLPLEAGTSKGLWPAFWMQPVTGGTAQLSIVEAMGSRASGTEGNRIVNTLHYDVGGSEVRQSNQTTLATPSDWHTYAVEWQPGELRFLVDGQLVWTRTAQTTPWLDEAYSQAFNLHVNLAVGGSWPGSPDSATEFPADLRLDYVRVYQR